MDPKIITLAAWIASATLISFSLGMTMNNRHKEDIDKGDKALISKIHSLEAEIHLLKTRVADLEKPKGGK